MPVCLHTVYGCFGSRMSDLTSFDRDHTPCKAENSQYLALHKKVYLPLPKSRTQTEHIYIEFFCKHQKEKLHCEQAAGQNYYQNTMKTLFIFFIWFSPSAQWSFPEATWYVMSQQTTCRSRHAIQLFSLKPNIKRDLKKVLLFGLNIFFF